MSLLNVNPNRMEMNQLKRKLDIARRGHRLLKEKQDALIREYVGLVEETKNARLTVEASMRQLHHHYKVSSVQMDEKSLQDILQQTKRENNVKVSERSLKGIVTLHYELESPILKPVEYSVISTPAALDQVTTMYPQILPELIELANHEKKCFAISHELKITRRRVNSLEFKTIPQMEATIRMIQLRIDDLERTQVARNMKVVNHQK